MMCERDEKLDKVQYLVEESLWLAHAIRLWTHTIYSKKQASKRLKKTIDDARYWFMHKG
jgi:hypothetical protein